MIEKNMTVKTNVSHRLMTASILLACLSASTAYAETGRGFIGPLEYQLPGNLSAPINILVEYGYIDSTHRQWNSSGSKVGAPDVRVNVSLTKYVHAWTLESNPNIGVGWEVIAPLVSVQNNSAHTTASGMADPIAGGFAWYKPTKDTTIGTDFLFQAPLGNSSVGGGDRWRIIQSVFGAVQFGGLNYTADLVWDWPGKNNSTDIKAPTTLSTHHRVGYSVTSLLMPYIGVDYERQMAKNGQPMNYEAVADVGMMFTFSPNYSLAVHYGRGLKGENRSVTDAVNARFVYVW
ncbi:transporter [Glaciimonas immobilis]|uniref:Transporter n=1 Tax=Glaciimonas immobilis TaxID=728004 RepID=A0A840RZP0_9BURK|nr:transporter [Glaciimonas immobilis]KAF3996051.1 transporter [Glaciimonas immobilis]MBB5201819.1 hypothetical protein [Glaciimonas immobilis]